MFSRSNTIEKHMKSGYFLEADHSTIEFIPKWMFSRSNKIQKHMKTGYFL